VGGIGSGPNVFKKKATVGESLALDLSTLIRRCILSQDGCTGNIEWLGRGAVSFRSSWEGAALDGLRLELSYRLGEREIQQLIRFDAAQLTYGRRVFFRCPLFVNESPCQNRATKLYLPPRAHYFGCRRCHDLTYLSCREADKRLGSLDTLAGLWRNEMSPLLLLKAFRLT